MGWTSLASLLFVGGFFAWQFLLTLYLQGVLGWSPLKTGSAFAVGIGELLIAPILTPRLVERFGNVPVMITGLLAAALQLGWMLRLDESWGFVELLPSLVLMGLAFALVYGPLTAAATEGLDEVDHGAAGGLIYTGFQLGAALGVSIATIVLVGGSHSDSVVATDFQRAFVVPAAVGVLAVLVGFGTLVRKRRSDLAAR